MKNFLKISALTMIVSISAFMLQAQTKQLTLNDIWASRDFYPSNLADIQSMNDGEHYCVLEKGAIDQYEYKTGKMVKTIFSEAIMKMKFPEKKLEIDSYEFSKDEKKILFASGTEDIYRHSSQSDYYVWDLATQEITTVCEKGKVRLAEFSPDATKIAFVKDNNLFIKDLVNKKETQITKDGLINNIINGTTDWVYEEEFSFTKAFFWSPDGNYCAFYRFDESKVKEFSLIMYGDLYPETYKYKYPKAGEDNSIVSVHVYDLTTGKTNLMDVGAETNQYIPRVLWTQEPGKLAIQRMNRLQNKLEILLADASSGKSQIIYTEINKYFIEVTDDWYFLSKGRFIISSEKNGYNHLYLYDITGKQLAQITAGNWDVMALVTVDEKKELVYYSSGESTAINKDLYCIRLDGSKKTRLTPNTGWNESNFGKGCKYFINNYSNGFTPPEYSVYSADGKFMVKLLDNSRVIKKTEDYGFVKPEFFTFKTTEGVELNGWMIKPANMDSTKKYPVFMYCYGGPGAQTVMNRWGGSNYLWFEMLSQKGYMVVSVDNRGTGFKGEEFQKCTYMQLGKLETIDQIETAKWLATKSYVDAKRIGIFGWSYGGYLSTLCMTKGSNYFKAGIAVAPVTNWRYYDNIYTERYMRTPQENGASYDENSPISHVKLLKGPFLLVHGTGDDNVHMQNSMDLITALVNENKNFDMQFYPNKNHSIYGGYTRLHLYRKMTDFILKNL